MSSTLPCEKASGPPRADIIGLLLSCAITRRTGRLVCFSRGTAAFMLHVSHPITRDVCVLRGMSQGLATVGGAR